ncbi:hypothetical protein CFP56_009028 [Quercus suber]|uniref:Uncharacterized protein n=1 Tax=Quercus suber TaxID=58331 RepID=A0AAW0L5G0_QUESU
MRKRGSWEGNNHLDYALIVEVKCKLWMLRGSGTSVFCPFGSRSRGSIFVLCVPGAWNCITSSSSSSTTCSTKPSLLILFLLHFDAIFCFGRRDIKFEQKYLFTLDFNICGLRKTNETYHRWVK